jgi:hypothetical protein
MRERSYRRALRGHARENPAGCAVAQLETALHGTIGGG